MAHDLQSLITVIDGILQQDRVLDDRKKPLVESLLEKVASLKGLLEKSVTLQHCLRGNNKEIIQELQSEIRDAAHEAEDIIESHALDQTLPELEATRSAIPPPDHSMSKVIEKLDAADYKLTNIINLQSHDEGETTMDAISNPSLSAAGADPKTNSALMMVGFEDDALHLKGRLTSHTRKREIIPIVGMGGIGKTTLARNIYDDPLILSHFDVRAWVTVSQDYNVRAILLGLLGSVSENISEDMLGDTLYRRLYGKRYLVVLDDIWSEKAWDEVQRYFPKEEIGSRILITSRELDVAKHPDSACEEHQMHLLSDAQGWDLLRQKVFEKDEHCPPFFEEIGRKVVTNCRGLPLAISVIGGLLSVDKYSKDLWDKVARDVRSITDDHISEILCLSYDNLPLHLKPCFLYMSAFPEDFKVRRSKLLKLLVAEGFLWRSNEESNKSLEDMAEESLKALVDRNLLSVTSTKYNGRPESYGMHDLLRDLCVRKAEDEKFLCIIGKYKKNVNNFRRLSVHHQFTEAALDPAETLSCARSLLFNVLGGHTTNIISSRLSSLRLVRVLDVKDFHFDDFPIEILKLANLRFLAVKFRGSLPRAIWRLRNLQTLLVDISRSEGNVILPFEAWAIPGLRHIILGNYLTIGIGFKVSRVHENLQTISGVCIHDLLGSNLINNIPNIKKLEIDGFGFVSQDRIVDLTHLHNLENLKLVRFFCAAVMSLLKLPDCLKKLCFNSCALPMGLVNGVGDLQYLQVLKIKNSLFQLEEYNEEEEEEEEEEDTMKEEDIVEEEDDDDDSDEEDNNKEQEWEVNEGVEFCSLQFLELHNLRIKRWKADYSHFPILKHLKIQLCEDLKEIPACIGEMSTLELIEVYEPNPSQVDWANEVREAQRHEYGNDTLQIRFNY